MYQNTSGMAVSIDTLYVCHSLRKVILHLSDSWWTDY